MCRSISFISGKGGSGKTSLALSIASLLSSCGINVLLLDCDLSTNGATYFYEDRLSDYRGGITSFHDLLFGEFIRDIKCMTVGKHYDFLPSITRITKDTTKVYTYQGSDTIFRRYLNTLCKKYDVLLFDCQAGYTDILRLILPLIDMHLVVMETDSISSAAMRSLHLKIGDCIAEKRTYQVFNKASKEEYETYSKITGGAIFTNIETVKFDWKIRRAFSSSQIPDMENTSAGFGEQVYAICNALFQAESIQKRLTKFRSKLNLHACTERKHQLEVKLTLLHSEHQRTKRKLFRNQLHIFTVIVMFLASMAMLTFVLRSSEVWPSSDSSEMITAVMITGVISCMVTFILTSFTKQNPSSASENVVVKIRAYEKELRSIIETMQKESALNQESDTHSSDVSAQNQ